MDQRTKNTNNKRFVRYSEGAEMYSGRLLQIDLKKNGETCMKILDFW